MTDNVPIDSVPLNVRADCLLHDLDGDRYGVRYHLEPTAHWWDFGLDAPGGLAAGLLLADVCTAGLAMTSIVPGRLAGGEWPHVAVRTDHPLRACLLAQYAGWALDVDGFFGMGSGPMRAAAGVEELFEQLAYREVATAVVGVIETGKRPTAALFESIAQKCHVEPSAVTLCVAPTSSQAGNVQVVARSVETALHKLHELGFDVRRIASGYGVAPLPPVAANDLTGIGRTNDAILYGATVHLWATGDDDTLADVVKRVPSSASDAHGQPFLDLFEAAGRDFYAIDPHLFSPAVIVLHNLDTGVVHTAGETGEAILRTSFGL
jgi:methenyltetrahydromethanopterin cyclohydrolase